MSDEERHHGTFAEGEADPEEHPEDEHVGTFAEGEADPEEHPEDEHVGTFAEGEEVIGEDTPRSIARAAGATRTSSARRRAQARATGASRWVWRSGVIVTTFQTRPSLSHAADDQPPDGSGSHRRRPCSAERGNAWWLWCQASPNEASASQETLVDSSSVSKRRRPKKWQTELIDQVTWCRRNTRTRPPHSSAVSAPASVPVMSKPSADGSARPSDDERDERAVDAPHARRPRSRSRAYLRAVGLAVLGRAASRRGRARARARAPLMPSPWPTWGEWGRPPRRCAHGACGGRRPSR